MDEVCIHMAQGSFPLLVLEDARNWLFKYDREILPR